MNKRIGDIITGLIFIFIAGAFYFERELRYPANVFPYTVIFLLLVLAIIMIIRAVLYHRPKDSQDEPKQKRNRRQVILLILGSVVFVMLIDIFGFYLMSVLYLMIIAVYLQPVSRPIKNRIFSSAFMSAIVLSLIFFFFNVLLNVPTPKGILF